MDIWLSYYKIVYNNFDNNNQKEYAKIHKVYYQIKGDIMKFNPKKIKIKSQNFFYPSNPLKMDKSDVEEEESKMEEVD